jgi:inorganic triphosphatase YgiF
MALEREHKFLLADTFPDTAALRAVYEPLGLELRLSAPREQHDVYYDTPTLTLLDAGVALRIRRFGGEMLATYKAAGEVHGSLHAREELEFPYSAPWPPEILERLAALGVLNDLGPLVALDTKRTRYLIYRENRALAELSLDDVTGHYSAQQVAFKELELEAQPELSDATFAELATALHGLELTPHTGDKLSYTLSQLGLLNATP